MSEYFPKLKSSGINIKVELYLSNYATKANLEMHHTLILWILLNRLI